MFYIFICKTLLISSWIFFICVRMWSTTAWLNLQKLFFWRAVLAERNFLMNKYTFNELKLYYWLTITATDTLFFWLTVIFSESINIRSQSFYKWGLIGLKTRFNDVLQIVMFPNDPFLGVSRMLLRVCIILWVG